MSTSLISVIVPSYNVGKYLNRFFKSVLDQTYKNLEVIFVNDASTDNTGELCDDFAARYNFVKVFHNDRNGGLSVARNVALEHVTGDYISFIDADDEIDVGFYEKMYSFATQNDCDIVVCGRYQIYQKKATKTIVYTEKSEVPNKKQTMQKLLDDTIGSHACDKLYKKELWSDKRFIPGRVFGEDIAIMHEIFDAAERIGFIAEPLYHYYINDSSISTSYRSFKWMSLYLAFKERLEFAERKYPDMTRNLESDTVQFARLTLDNYLIRKDACDEPYLAELVDLIKKQKNRIGQLSNMKWYNKWMIRYYNFSPTLYGRTIKIIHKIFYAFHPNVFNNPSVSK